MIMKKIIASILSASFALSLCNFSKVDAYHEGQKHTWRVYEKVSAASHIYKYESKLINVNNYEYVLHKTLPLIKDLTYSGGYDPVDKTLFLNAETDDNKKIIMDEGYLTVSTWRTPTEIKNFNIAYDYETSSGAKITLVPIMAGDVNQDKYVNKLDSEMIANYLLGSIKLSENQLLAADTDNNGKVDFQDTINIEKFASGNIKFFKQADEM